MAWAKPDFLPGQRHQRLSVPRGQGMEFPARVSVTTAPGWRVVTGLDPDGAAGAYRADELSRPGGHAVLHRPSSTLDSAQIGRHLASTGQLSRRASSEAPDARSSGSRSRRMVPAEVQRIRRDAVEELLHHADLRALASAGAARWSTRAPTWASTIPVHGHAAAGLDHRPRNLPRLERETAAAQPTWCRTATISPSPPRCSG